MKKPAPWWKDYPQHLLLEAVVTWAARKGPQMRVLDWKWRHGRLVLTVCWTVGPNSFDMADVRASDMRLL